MSVYLEVNIFTETQSKEMVALKYMFLRKCIFIKKFVSLSVLFLHCVQGLYRLKMIKLGDKITT